MPLQDFALRTFERLAGLSLKYIIVENRLVFYLYIYNLSIYIYSRKGAQSSLSSSSFSC